MSAVHCVLCVECASATAVTSDDAAVTDKSEIRVRAECNGERKKWDGREA